MREVVLMVEFVAAYKLDVVGMMMIFVAVVELRLIRFRVLYLDERIHDDEYVVMQKQLGI